MFPRRLGKPGLYVLRTAAILRPPMPDAPAVPESEITYPVEYERFAGTTGNPHFKSKGVLTVRSAGPTYVFSGKRQGLFAYGSDRLVLIPDDIANVVVDGALVQFTTRQGRAGKQGRPFTFYCRSEAEAREVAALLPKNVDREFTESRDFADRLNAVAGPVSPWTSVTNIIIALNAVVFVIMGALGAGWFQTTSLLPYILYGANNGAATTDGEWWRLLTSMFMHYGLLHLLFNMWALFTAGGFLEKLQGRALFAFIYLGAGLAGGFASIAWHGDKSWSAGASGAVFGVYGAVFGYMLREKKSLPPSVFQSMLKSSLTFGAYNILYGLGRAGIDNAAHFGGAAAGIAFGWMLALPLERDARARLLKPRLILGLAALAALVGAGVVFSPRFNYRVGEEFVWSRTNRPFLNREDTLIQENEVALRQLARGKSDPAYPDWLETQLIPFYEDWIKALGALSLTPGKTTAMRQAETLSIFRLRVESYRRLATGLRKGERGAAQEFFLANAKASEAIIKMHQAYDR